ncbi:MAG: HEAT repeat domain-containing protein [Pseudomonadota bacterium]
MPLKTKSAQSSDEAAAAAPAALEETATRQELETALGDDDAGVRRRAARALAQDPEAAPALAARLLEESAPSVRVYLFEALRAIGGAPAVEALTPLLRLDDADLRGGAVQALQRMPEAVGPAMTALLTDEDADVRLMAIDVLQDLAHPEAGQWLAETLERESEVNVVGAALDRLAEIGGPEHAPLIIAARDRFADQPFIAFAAGQALASIEGST